MKQIISHQRLYSLDALRGFAMFWIMGADRVFHKLGEITGTSFWNTLSDQFNHAAWHGFTFYDLIFPLFLFVTGVASPYSIGKRIDIGKSK